MLLDLLMLLLMLHCIIIISIYSEEYFSKLNEKHYLTYNSIFCSASIHLHQPSQNTTSIKVVALSLTVSQVQVEIHVSIKHKYITDALLNI